MRDGLYKIAFQTPHGTGAGVAHLVGGRIWGGDGGLFYTGSYKIEGPSFVGTVETASHTDHPGLVSVFGVNRAKVHVVGFWQGDTADLKGTAAEAPEVEFTMRLERLVD